MKSCQEYANTSECGRVLNEFVAKVWDIASGGIITKYSRKPLVKTNPDSGQPVERFALFLPPTGYRQGVENNLTALRLFLSQPWHACRQSSISNEANREKSLEGFSGSQSPAETDVPAKRRAKKSKRQEAPGETFNRFAPLAMEAEETLSSIWGDCSTPSSPRASTSTMEWPPSPQPFIQTKMWTLGFSPAAKFDMPHLNGFTLNEAR
ncbi:hypothetical protein PoB_001496900 [Plakobranchus ocellatus]|uniref:Uncharacterized protein n=1 Tax=Plakobranchus ocellatus TaxID=259542 RepID=A0AAV3Z358_9GAST|nr:hypothetical protein PoB_001496900 [Plakobranchus ocellatus]